MLLFLFLIDSCFFIPAAIVQILNRIAEHVKPIGILSKGAKAEIKMHLVTAEAKIRKCSI